MTRTIVIANQKGGVGKTTLVANLGAALAECGQKVILVDVDPQGALTATLGHDPYTLTRTVYTLLTSDTASPASVLRPVLPNLVLVPASVDLAAIEYLLADDPDRALRLKYALGRSRIPADYVLIDTPPTMGLLTINALAAAHELLIPVQCQYLAMRGVRSLLETIWRVHERLNPHLSLLGVVPTLYRPESTHAQEVVVELRSVFEDKVFAPAIPAAEEVAEAPVAHKSVLAYRPASPAATAFRTLAETIIHVHTQPS
jgi:chromosome partitioning protein